MLVSDFLHILLPEIASLDAQGQRQFSTQCIKRSIQTIRLLETSRSQDIVIIESIFYKLWRNALEPTLNSESTNFDLKAVCDLLDAAPPDSGSIFNIVFFDLLLSMEAILSEDAGTFESPAGLIADHNIKSAYQLSSDLAAFRLSRTPQYNEIVFEPIFLREITRQRESIFKIRNHLKAEHRELLKLEPFCSKEEIAELESIYRLPSP